MAPWFALFRGNTKCIVEPHVPGHELAGTIAEVGGNVTRWQPGDLISHRISLGEAPAALMQLPGAFPAGSRLLGDVS
jgi:NADPH:quinone reductase-like Zn-dependent oxidoreductase